MMAEQMTSPALTAGYLRVAEIDGDQSLLSGDRPETFPTEKVFTASRRAARRRRSKVAPTKPK